MGSRNTTNRRIMSNNQDNDQSSASRNVTGSRAHRPITRSISGGLSVGNDLTLVLSQLIENGQIRIVSSGGSILDDEDDDDSDEGDTGIRPDKPPPIDPNPDTSRIDASKIKEEIRLSSGLAQHGQRGYTRPLTQVLQQREVGLNRNERFSHGDCCQVNSNYLPNHREIIARFQQKVFCGAFSRDGDIFLSACQDRRIRIYDTANGRFKMFKRVQARDMGWSVLDTAFSPDGNYLIYSSWSDLIHICNIYGDDRTHEALNLYPDSVHSFCIFSLFFSSDNKEILGGANDGCIYIYDRERNTRSLRIDAHDDDVNAVTFADLSSNILYSGGDDGLVKVWDRRTLREENPEPVGALAGHSDGITYIDSKGDSRCLISNCKDQTIKLWDIRKFSNADAQEATKREVSGQHWDYRWQQVPRKLMKRKKSIPGDTSVMTYRGHCVLNTLVRARFSPHHSTGQRYIYCGCATGYVIIYDVLTGRIVKKLTGHRACVRDVSWHPYENEIISSSWDNSVARWTYSSGDYLDTNEDMMERGKRSNKFERLPHFHCDTVL